MTKPITKTVVKIKTASNVGWMSRHACIQALRAIGWTTEEAETYLSTPRK
jgi:hypothetical protein